MNRDASSPYTARKNIFLDMAAKQVGAATATAVAFSKQKILSHVTDPVIVSGHEHF